MTYALDFSDEAKAAFLTLDVILQELALDAIEDLAASPQPERGSIVSDFTHERAGLIHYVFLEVRVAGLGTSLKIVRIGHFARRA